MFVIHAYDVLGMLHVSLYVPGGAPPVGSPMEESRLLGRSTRSIGAEPTEETILKCVSECFEQMLNDGADVQAILEV